MEDASQGIKLKNKNSAELKRSTTIKMWQGMCVDVRIKKKE